MAGQVAGLTGPQGQVALPDGSTPHPEATALAGFIDKLHASGLGALDPNIQVALSQGPKASPVMPAILGTISDTVKKAEVPFTSVYHEASQHTLPSVGNYFSSAINGTNNHLSSMNINVLDTQKQLQSAGYGTSLSANGVWSTGTSDSQWSTAFINWQQDQLRKPGVGGTSAKGFFQRIAHDVDPRYSLPALWRGIASMVPAIQRLIAHTAGSVVDTLAMQNKQGNTPTIGSKISYALEPGTQAGYSNVTDAQALQEKSQMYGMSSIIGDAGTAINLYFAHGLLGSAGGTLARAGSEALTAGGGNIAKGAVTSLGKESAVKTANMMNAFVLKPLSGVAKSVAGLGKVGLMGFLPDSALANIPALREVFPYIDSLKGSALDGWTTVRNTANIPYRFPIVRGTAPLFSKAVFGGGVEEELAHAENSAGDKNNPLVTSMDHLTPIAGDLGKGLYAAQFLLHSGYDAPGKIATWVGKGFSGAYDKLSNALGDQSLYSQWERATGATFAKTNQSLIDAGLSSHTLTTSIAQQNQEAAVSWAAKVNLDRQIVSSDNKMSSADILLAFQKAKNDIWDNPDVLAQATHDFSLVKNGFQAHVARSSVEAKTDEFVSPSKGIVNFEKAKEQARVALKDAHNLQTPESVSALKNVSNTDNFAPTLHNFALMKKTSMTSDELRALVDKTSKTTQDQDELHNKLVDIAFNKLGVGTHILAGKDSSGIEEFLHDYAKLLPASVYPSKGPFNIQQETQPFAQEALDKIDALGYKLGYGTHTGHALTDPIVPLQEVGLKEGLLSKTLNNVGLGLTKTSNTIFSSLANSNKIAYLQKYFDKGAFDFPPGFGPTETMSLLHRGIDKQLSPMEKWFGKYGTMHIDNAYLKPVAKALSAGRWDSAINEMMKAKGIRREEAKLYVQELLAQQKGSANWTQKQVVDVLTSPYLKDYKGNLDEQLASSLGVRADQPFTNSEATAIKFYRLMKEGERKTPLRLQGIGKFTDLLGNQFFLSGLPMGMSGERLPNVTNELKQRLLSLRYPANLEFSWKRVAKTQMKAASIGIPMSANSGTAMKVAGTYDSDMKLLKYYKPQEFTGGHTLDDALREAEQSDLYNVFNPQEIQARILGFVHREMMSDPANRIDTYKPNFTKNPNFVRPVIKSDPPAYEGGTSLFHGASTDLSKTGLDANVYRESDKNLFGDGFYTTDNWKVANGYTKKGTGGEPTNHTVTWNGKGIPKFVNLDKPANSDLKQVFSSLNKEDFYDFSNLEESLAKQNVTGVELYKSLRQDLREEGSGDLSAETFQEVTTQLEGKGYDGIRHLGGSFRTSDGPSHNVTIWLKPNDLTVSKYVSEPPSLGTSEFTQGADKLTSSKLTPDAEKQMLKQLDNVYSYGDRSALERSTNAIFFPFSFEKTLMRQLGTHLLDHQGQLLLAGTAINFYDSHNGPVAKKWAEDNLPVIKLLESFYPYSNSFGLGVFGGIQRVMVDPFLRATLALFSPKVVQGSKSTEAVKALVGALPMFKEANQLFGGVDLSGKSPNNPGGDFGTTVGTSIWYINSKFNSFLTHSPDDIFRPHGEQPYKVQVNNAFNLESQLVSHYASDLKANHSGGDWHFPDNMPYVGRVADLPAQKITMDAIKTIVQSVYPAWDKNKGLQIVSVAKDRAALLQRDIALKNPDLLPDYKWFVKNSEFVVKELQADKIDIEKLAGETQQLRNKAVELSVLDRDFAAFYKKYYQSKFGPLEAIR